MQRQQWWVTWKIISVTYKMCMTAVICSWQITCANISNFKHTELKDTVLFYPMFCNKDGYVRRTLINKKIHLILMFCMDICAISTPCLRLWLSEPEDACLKNRTASDSFHVIFSSHLILRVWHVSRYRPRSFCSNTTSKRDWIPECGYIHDNIFSCISKYFNIVASFNIDVNF